MEITVNKVNERLITLMSLRSSRFLHLEAGKAERVIISLLICSGRLSSAVCVSSGSFISMGAVSPIVVTSVKKDKEV